MEVSIFLRERTFPMNDEKPNGIPKEIEGASYSPDSDDTARPESDIHSSADEYEVSYDTQSGEYTHTKYRAPETAPVPSVGGKKKSKKGGFAALALLIICICIILSTLLGSLSGALAFLLLDRADNGEGSLVTEENASVKINYAEVDTTVTVNAAQLAKPSVVVIDIFNSQSALDRGENSGSGSGVIWTENGYIVTCNHVVQGAPYIVVTLDSGDRMFAEIIGCDPKTDMAVIKVDTEDALPAVTLRGTDLLLGESVIAIGNPLGTYSNTVTNGIISCLERQIRVEGQTMTLLQTNAAVNPGNSGGGLFDANGSLVGIVNAKSSDDTVEGIGFAIPISTAQKIASDLIELGYVSGRPSFAFEAEYVNSTNYKNYPDLYDYVVSGTWIKRITSGVYITSLQGVSYPTDKSERLEFGDRIVQVDGRDIRTDSDLISALSGHSVGDSVEITVVRDHKTTVSITVILVESGNHQ